MNLIYRILLTTSATFLMIVVYSLNVEWPYIVIPNWGISLLLLLIPLLFSLISIRLADQFGCDSIDSCEECSLADHEFLPTYLGYFFVSLSISDNITMIFVYGMVFLFVFISQSRYFNPIFLFLGYHYYNVRTSKGTRVFVIAKGKIIRKERNIVFNDLRRINDTTYISVERNW